MRVSIKFPDYVNHYRISWFNFFVVTAYTNCETLFGVNTGRQ